MTRRGRYLFQLCGYSVCTALFAYTALRNPSPNSLGWAAPVVTGGMAILAAVRLWMTRGEPEPLPTSPSKGDNILKAAFVIYGFVAVLIIYYLRRR
jgi:hypothetical protein